MYALDNAVGLRVFYSGNAWFDTVIRKKVSEILFEFRTVVENNGTRSWVLTDFGQFGKKNNSFCHFYTEKIPAYFLHKFQYEKNNLKVSHHMSRVGGEEPRTDVNKEKNRLLK